MQRKNNEDGVVSPVGKGLSLQVDDTDTGAVRVSSDSKKNVEYLMGMGFHHGLRKPSGDVANDKKEEEEQQKNFYFKLPEEAKQYVTKQGDSLEIPKTAFVMQLSVLTTNGPIPIQHYRQWKQSNPAMANVSSTSSSIKSTPGSRKTDITSNLDPESVRSKKSEVPDMGRQSPGTFYITFFVFTSVLMAVLMDTHLYQLHCGHTVYESKVRQSPN